MHKTSDVLEIVLLCSFCKEVLNSSVWKMTRVDSLVVTNLPRAYLSTLVKSATNLAISDKTS